MKTRVGHRKRVLHYDEPGDCRELTFSCYRRLPLLTNDYWQEGPGYDRNLNTIEGVRGSIDYLHLNPVRRKLVREPLQWRWSSCRYYASDGRHHDSALPTVQGMPAEFWEK